MNNLSKRLKAIVQYVDTNDSLVDVGCDHGLLSIYLVSNKLVKNIIASDINENALSSAIKNIKDAGLEIETIVSDGIDSIDLTNINSLIIAGMGTVTIKHILSDDKKLERIEKIIIQSNNNHYELRSYMNDIGYYLKDESYVLDKGIWYVTCCFIKTDKKNEEQVLKYGLLNNKEYNEYLIKSKEDILSKIPVSSKEAREECLKELKDLKNAICK